MSTSIPPNADAMLATAAATDCSSVTSVRTVIAVPPAAAISLSIFFAPASSISMRATRAFCSAKARAVTAPMPCDAPVTTTARPLNSG